MKGDVCKMRWFWSGILNRTVVPTLPTQYEIFRIYTRCNGPGWYLSNEGKYYQNNSKCIHVNTRDNSKCFTLWVFRFVTLPIASFWNSSLKLPVFLKHIPDASFTDELISKPHRQTPHSVCLRSMRCTHSVCSWYVFLSPTTSVTLQT